MCSGILFVLFSLGSLLLPVSHSLSLERKREERRERRRKKKKERELLKKRRKRQGRNFFFWKEETVRDIGEFIPTAGLCGQSS
jgi:hypothetical protein